jgi:hypothetical protein
MVFWETAHPDPNVPPHIAQYARDWQAAEKIRVSHTSEGDRVCEHGVDVLLVADEPTTEVGGDGSRNERVSALWTGSAP